MCNSQPEFWKKKNLFSLQIFNSRSGFLLRFPSERPYNIRHCFTLARRLKSDVLPTTLGCKRLQMNNLRASPRDDSKSLFTALWRPTTYSSSQITRFPLSGGVKSPSIHHEPLRPHAIIVSMNKLKRQNAQRIIVREISVGGGRGKTKKTENLEIDTHPIIIPFHRGRRVYFTLYTRRRVYRGHVLLIGTWQRCVCVCTSVCTWRHNRTGVT